MNQPTSNGLYSVSNGITSSNPFIEVFETRPPTVNDLNYPIQKRWFDTITNNEYVLIGFTSTAAVLQAVWALTSVGPLGSVLTLTGDAGGPVSPSSGNINLSSASTTFVTGVPGTNTLTTEVSFDSNEFLLGQGAGSTAISFGPLDDGELIIGRTGNSPVTSTLTAGSGIGIVNAPGSITISSNGTGFTWIEVLTATQNMNVETGYITNHVNVSYTLPSAANIGDTIRVLGKDGLTTILQNANQQIFMGSGFSTLGITGSVSGTDDGDCIELICITGGPSTIWQAASWVGNWTIL